jgi:DNA modification methylase
VTSALPVEMTYADEMQQAYEDLLIRKAGTPWAMTQDYDIFLKDKMPLHRSYGEVIELSRIHTKLFPYQRDIVAWAVKKGRAAIFADVGLGKTNMQGEWARQLHLHARANTLFVAPLLVTYQTIEELCGLGMDVRYADSQSEVDLTVTPYWITNYDNIGKFNARAFQAVVLDESSILKAYSGETKKLLVEMFKDTPYRLACTATPAPNDLGEIGNHAEFLGVMTSKLMTAVYFTHDSKAAAPGASKYRLKKHSVKNFYRWLSSWAVAFKTPSDLGYSDEGYALPALNIHVHTVKTSYTPKGMLPGMGTQAISATEANRVRRATIQDRLSIAHDLCTQQYANDQVLVWTGLNDEDEALMEALPDAVRVWGTMKNNDKRTAFGSWASGEKRILVTKDSIAGAGMNMQFASVMLFFGIDFSWEGFYQAIGRMYRFGQTRDVNVHIIISEAEMGIYNTVVEKGKEAAEMTQNLIKASRGYMRDELEGRNPDNFVYRSEEWTSKGGKATLWLGDSCRRMKEIASNSIHFSLHSPPFGHTIFVYTATNEDLGNSLDMMQFLRQYRRIARELLRITMPGRVAVVHIQDIKRYANRDGVRGIRALSDTISRMFEGLGWVYRGRVTVQKNPQAVATRNHDTDLLFVTGKRDSTDLAPLNTDYALIFKKPGKNPIPVQPYEVNPATNKQEMTEEDWISNAHAIWQGTMEGIRETNTLNVAVARSDEDEKHLAPLQLDFIERFIHLYSNPGETVFSPFGGIGSEPYVAVKTGRRGFSCELKPKYWEQAKKFIQQAETQANGRTLFDLLAEQTPEEGAS